MSETPTEELAAPKPLVVLIDDDHGPMDLYACALESAGYDVQHIDQADDVRGWLEDENTKAPACVLMDIMMPCSHATQEWLGVPTPKDENEAVDRMMETGVWAAKRVREKFPNVPMLAFTNSDIDYSDLPQGMQIVRKFKTHYAKLPAAVEAAIKTPDMAI